MTLIQIFIHIHKSNIFWRGVTVLKSLTSPTISFYSLVFENSLSVVVNVRHRIASIFSYVFLFYFTSSSTRKFCFSHSSPHINTHTHTHTHTPHTHSHAHIYAHTLFTLLDSSQSFPHSVFCRSFRKDKSINCE